MDFVALAPGSVAPATWRFAFDGDIRRADKTSQNEDHINLGTLHQFA